jgi:hypothetical protein
MFLSGSFGYEISGNLNCMHVWSNKKVKQADELKTPCLKKRQQLEENHCCLLAPKFSLDPWK